MRQSVASSASAWSVSRSASTWNATRDTQKIRPAGLQQREGHFRRGPHEEPVRQFLQHLRSLRDRLPERFLHGGPLSPGAPDHGGEEIHALLLPRICPQGHGPQQRRGLCTLPARAGERRRAPGSISPAASSAPPPRAGVGVVPVSSGKAFRRGRHHAPLLRRSGVLGRGGTISSGSPWRRSAGNGNGWECRGS